LRCGPSAPCLLPTPAAVSWARRVRQRMMRQRGSRRAAAGGPTGTGRRLRTDRPLAAYVRHPAGLRARRQGHPHGSSARGTQRACGPGPPLSSGTSRRGGSRGAAPSTSAAPARALCAVSTCAARVGIWVRRSSPFSSTRFATAACIHSPPNFVGWSSSSVTSSGYWSSYGHHVTRWRILMISSSSWEFGGRRRRLGRTGSRLGDGPEWVGSDTSRCPPRGAGHSSRRSSRST
jgi:hypothetical protein